MWNSTAQRWPWGSNKLAQLLPAKIYTWRLATVYHWSKRKTVEINPELCWKVSGNRYPLNSGNIKHGELFFTEIKNGNPGYWHHLKTQSILKGNLHQNTSQMENNYWVHNVKQTVSRFSEGKITFPSSYFFTKTCICNWDQENNFVGFFSWNKNNSVFKKNISEWWKPENFSLLLLIILITFSTENDSR